MMSHRQHSPKVTDTQKNERIPEIDLLRGVAVAAMIVYHFLFIVDTFGNPSHPVTSQLQQWIALDNHFVSLYAQTIRFTFIGLVGVSLWLSASKAGSSFVKKQLLRAAQIGLLALLISVGSFMFDPATMIRFGILHLIAVSIVLALPFVTKPKISLVIGTFIAAVGFRFIPIATQIPHLFWLGLTLPSKRDLDYFPLVPWFGLVLIGIWLGWVLYGNKRRSRLPKELKSRAKSQSLLNFLSKHALVLYVIHPPLLFLLLYVFNMVQM